MMLRNEFCKIWNWRTILLLLLVGGVWFVRGVMGQMNLEYLPLFETVDAETGAELVEEFGASISKSELYRIEEKMRQAEDRLEQKKRETEKRYRGELEKLFVHTWRELEDTLRQAEEDADEGNGLEEHKRAAASASAEYILPDENGFAADDNESMDTAAWYEQLTDLEAEMISCWEWEEEEVNYYDELMQYGTEPGPGVHRYLFFLNPWTGAVSERAEEIKARDYISFLPSSVESNLHYVLEDFSRMMMLLTILMVVPYIEGENRSGVYSIAATTRTGRALQADRIRAVLLSVAVLYFACVVSFCLAYHRITPYSIFGDCVMNGNWFDLTLRQFLGISLGFLFGGCIFMACLCMFMTSFSRTVIGMTVAALPCWGIGELLGLSYYGRILEVSPDFAGLKAVISGIKAGDPLFLVVLLLLGAGLVIWLYRRRLGEDIVE